MAGLLVVPVRVLLRDSEKESADYPADDNSV